MCLFLAWEKGGGGVCNLSPEGLLPIHWGGQGHSVNHQTLKTELSCPRSTVGNGHQSNESYARECPWNRTISTVLWVHRKLPQSTVKQVLPSNQSYESKTGLLHCNCSDQLQGVPGPPGPKCRKSLKKVLPDLSARSAKKSAKKVPKKSKKSRKSLSLALFRDFFGTFLALRADRPGTTFLRLFRPGGPGTPCNWSLQNRTLATVLWVPLTNYSWQVPCCRNTLSLLGGNLGIGSQDPVANPFPTEQ